MWTKPRPTSLLIWVRVRGQALTSPERPERTVQCSSAGRCPCRAGCVSERPLRRHVGQCREHVSTTAVETGPWLPNTTGMPPPPEGVPVPVSLVRRGPGTQPICCSPETPTHGAERQMGPCVPCGARPSEYKDLDAHRDRETAKMCC